MSSIGLLLVALLWSCSGLAQSRISLQGGWTASKIRAENKRDFRPGPVAGDSFTKFPFWHTPLMGIKYEYDHKRLRLSTGFIMMSMGAGGMPGFSSYPWVVAYWTLPLLGGYKLKLDKGWTVTTETGMEIGFQNGKYIGGPQTAGANWGNINVVAAVEAEWKNFRLGVRGHLGVTNFRRVYVLIYKHTGITTYLGYTLWDQAQCKARRLRKQQERALE